MTAESLKPLGVRYLIGDQSQPEGDRDLVWRTKPAGVQLAKLWALSSLSDKREDHSALSLDLRNPRCRSLGDVSSAIAGERMGGVCLSTKGSGT